MRFSFTQIVEITSTSIMTRDLTIEWIMGINDYDWLFTKCNQCEQNWIQKKFFVDKITDSEGNPIDPCLPLLCTSCKTIQK